MTSKEALENLKIYLPAIYSEVAKCLNIIKQDLERKEELEKENQELKKSNKEIERLYLNENKHWCETIDNLRKENKELKDKGALSLTIEWLRTRVKQLEKELKMYKYIIKNGKASRGRYKLLIDWNNNYTAYEFIKEVLGNDK